MGDHSIFCGPAADSGLQCFNYVPLIKTRRRERGWEEKKKKKEGEKRKLVGVISLLVLQFPNTVYAHTTNIYLISDDTTRRRQDPEIFLKNIYQDRHVRWSVADVAGGLHPADLTSCHLACFNRNPTSVPEQRQIPYEYYTNMTVFRLFVYLFTYFYLL